MLTFGVTVLPDPPHTRFVELFQLAEEQGFDWGWTYDSHILWQESIPLLTLAVARHEHSPARALRDEPGHARPDRPGERVRDAAGHLEGRMFMGIGRGDSARRVIGLDPVKMAEFERSLVMIKDLMNGRPVEWNGKELELKWAKGRPEIPVYVAGYGPEGARRGRTRRRRRRHPARRPGHRRVDHGHRPRARPRTPAATRPRLSRSSVRPRSSRDDLAHAREQMRWFPAMVSNHVMDLLQRYPESELPPALYEYVKRREFYDYKDHSRVGAKHGEFVDDETCDRFCVLGTARGSHREARRLEEIGVGHWNIYLMTEGQEQILETYGRRSCPPSAAPSPRSANGRRPVPARGGRISSGPRPDRRQGLDPSGAGPRPSVGAGSHPARRPP